MSAPLPLHHPLRILVLVLGLGILVLGTMWLCQGDLPTRSASVGDASPSGGESRTPASPKGGRVAEAAGTRTDPGTPPAAGETPPRATLYGQVLDAAGQVVTTGTLWLYAKGAHLGTARISAEGFAFAGLAPGRYQIRGRVDGQLGPDRQIEVRAPQTRLDLLLDRVWRLRIWLEDPDGKPLQESVPELRRAFMTRPPVARAFATAPAKDLPPIHHPETELGLGRFQANRGMFTRTRGAKALPAAVIGDLILPPGKPVHVALMLRNRILAQREVTPGTEELRFRMSGTEFFAHLATLRLQAVDARGQPVAGASVSLPYAQIVPARNQTDAEGRIELARLRPGRARLSIRAKGLSGPTMLVDLSAGRTRDLGEITLRAPVELRCVLDGFGPKTSIRYTRLAASAEGRRPYQRYLSSEGEPEPRLHLYPGRYGFYVRSEAGVDQRVVDTAALDDGKVHFRAQAAARLQIINELHTGFGQLELYDHRGVLLTRRDIGTAAVGSLPLLPGQYRARIVDAAGRTRATEITLGRGGARLVLR